MARPLRCSRRMKTTSVLIALPCSVEFESMSSRGVNARFCDSCKKVVHDLSSLREREAKALLRSSPEGLCVRYLYDQLGNIWFRDTLASRLLNRARRAGAVAAVAFPALTLQACNAGTAFFADAARHVGDAGDAGDEGDEGDAGDAFDASDAGTKD